MFITIWQHSAGFDLFIRGYRRRNLPRRRPLVPRIEVARHETYLTAEEVGQLLGGN